MKNNFLLWLVALLVIANLASITVFWLGRTDRRPPPAGNASQYLIKELEFNENQKNSYLKLVSGHRRMAEGYRQEIRKAKDNFFDLLQEPSVSDTTKQRALHEISIQTESLDALTFDHFKKVRALCTPEQKEKFDNIIHEVLNLMAGPPPGGNHPGKLPPHP
jgi:hypothetical protein